MSWFIKNCSIKIVSAQPDNAADTLGIGGTSKNDLNKCQLNNIGQCMSFDINMNKDCRDFKEDIPHQRQMIVEEFKKHLDLIYNLVIYAETKHYTADKTTNPITYNYKGESKIHFHGMLTFNKIMSRSEYERFFKKIRDRFIIKSQTNKHRALFYKMVRDRNHRKMRLHYMTKQNLPNPILYNIDL